MSRSGYSDDCDGWDLIRWRGAVASAIRGKRGQAFLSELLAALDAMPQKELVAHSFQAGEGVCTLGAICATRGIPLPEAASTDPYYWEDNDARDFAMRALTIPGALAAEVMYENDECSPCGYFDSPEETPAARWTRMRAWVSRHIAKAAP